MGAKGRWAVVTGGVTGIGREIALTLARRGWDVAVSYIEDDGGPARLADEVAAAGREAHVAPCDAGIADDVEAFFDAAQRRFGRAPDVLVNNAGVQTWSPMLALREPDWDRVIRTNLKGCFLNMKKAARLMIAAKQAGTIVNIGSGCGKIPFPNLVDYSASKAGDIGFTKSLAQENARKGITVNAVCPGYIATEMVMAVPKEVLEKSVIPQIPVGRLGQPEEVARCVVFLVSDQAGFITGSVLTANGGQYMI